MVTGLSFSGTVAPWVLSAIGIALTIALGLTFRAWREAKRSPYFFQKKQAIQRMQSYSLSTVGLLLMAGLVAVYAYSPAFEAKSTVRLLTNAKPIQEVAQTSSREIDTADIGRVTSFSGSVRDTTAASAPVQSPSSINDSSDNDNPSSNNNEDAEFSVASISPEDARVDTLRFSTAMTEEYEPIGARTEFSTGNYTLFATFEYLDLTDGLTWSWIWRHDGNVVERGQQVWSYGDAGNGHVYFSPENGFTEGEYTLELWWDGKMVRQGNVDVNAGVTNR